MLSNTPPFFPHVDVPEILKMGLSPATTANWLQPDTDLADYFWHKKRIRAEIGDEVYRAQNSSLLAQQELQTMLLSHLLNDHGDLYCLDGETLVYKPAEIRWPKAGEQTDDLQTLWHNSLWVQDDICILQQRGEHYCLSAASLCSPSQWRLEEKVGQALDVIHQNIPGFSQALNPQVTRFFDHLRVHKPVVRYNWAVHSSPALYLVGDEPAAIERAPLYWRVERQSLRRLPITGAIVFTIRVYVHGLQTLAETPGVLTALISAIDECSPELAAYKGFDRIQPALARYRSRL